MAPPCATLSWDSVLGATVDQQNWQLLFRDPAVQKEGVLGDLKASLFRNSFGSTCKGAVKRSIHLGPQVYLQKEVVAKKAPFFGPLGKPSQGPFWGRIPCQNSGCSKEGVHLGPSRNPFRGSVLGAVYLKAGVEKGHLLGPKRKVCLQQGAVENMHPRFRRSGAPNNCKPELLNRASVGIPNKPFWGSVCGGRFACNKGPLNK